MSKHILKALPELVEAGVITDEKSREIQQYYERQPEQSSARLFIVFGILGALLVGMGIILILAHNWDILPKAIKLGIGFFPLLIGQGICAYLLFTKSQSRTWKEATASLLFLSVGVSISIVSQVYNIEGDLAGFLLIWMFVALPIVYVLRSSMASLLFIAGITWYATTVGYFSYPQDPAPLYLVLLILILPFYYTEFLRTQNKNNFYYFHSWLLALSLTVCLGVFTESAEELVMISYMSMFSAFVMMGQLEIFTTNRVITNAYLVIGSLGVIFLLLLTSFDWYWEEVNRFSMEEITSLLEFAVVAITTILAGGLLLILLRTKDIQGINAKAFAFIVFIVLVVIGVNAPQLAQWLINLVILLLAVHTIWSGAQQNHLGILNYGLLIITTLILCRFFDTDLSFVIRGLLFIAVGAGFFAANYYMIKKRKRQV